MVYPSVPGNPNDVKSLYRPPHSQELVDIDIYVREALVVKHSISHVIHYNTETSKDRGGNWNHEKDGTVLYTVL